MFIKGRRLELTLSPLWNCSTINYQRNLWVEEGLWDLKMSLVIEQVFKTRRISRMHSMESSFDESKPLRNQKQDNETLECPKVSFTMTGDPFHNTKRITVICCHHKFLQNFFYFYLYFAADLEAIKQIKSGGSPVSKTYLTLSIVY